MRIQHNILAMNAYRNYQNNTSALGKNLEKLSSGYRINRAGDDAAGLAISEKMRAQITGLDAAQKNVKDGISLVKTAEGAMQEIQDMLNRMDYLATQSANGTYQNEVDRENLQKEVNALRTEINRIADSSNFNGIKLLDGSLASEQSVDKIDLKGVISTKSAGMKAKFEMDAAFNTVSTKQEEGGTFVFNVGFDDGTSTTIKLTAGKKNDTDAEVTKVVAEDGTEYNIGAATPDGKITDVQLTEILTKELNKALDGEFTVAETAANSKTLEFTADEVGAGGRQIRSIDLTSYKADGTQLTGTNDIKAYTVKTTQQGLDNGVEIKAADITEYDGTNYEDAVFEINGHKFVLMTENLSAKKGTTTTDNDVDNYMQAVQGLGSDVTILVGGRGGLISGAAAGTAPGGSNANTANGNYDQNIKAIAKATGLNVGNAIDEVDADGNAAATGATPGGTATDTDGIRLTLGGKKAEGKGLTLQIGDTADDFNQLKVNIGDMHDVGMGIDKIDISTQAGAQSAIDTIKNAINYVSSIRGDLGAVQNRLEHTQNNLAVMQENIQDAESTIRDTDVAAEMMAYTKNNILVQSAQAMLAQANAVPQGVLQLLQ